MKKKTQSERQSEQRDTSAEPKTFRLDRSVLRYVFCSLALLILLAWTLMNFGSVAGAVGRIGTLLFPFLLGGGMAFLMNTLLRPLEAQWDRLRRGKGARLKRLICLTLSAVIVVGLLFAVAFIMIPSLRESGNEFVRSVPAYVEEIEQWWANVVQFAAKYNVVLPEYAIDADALTEKITAFINREGSGIITVTLGAATSILSGLIDVLLAFVFALYLLAKKEGIAAHLKRLTETVLPTKSARRSVLCGNAASAHSLRRSGFHLCGRDRADPHLWRVARRRHWRAADSAGGAGEGRVVCHIPAYPAAARRESDLSQGRRKIRRPSGNPRADGGHDRRRGVRRLGNALQRPRLRCALQPLSGVHEKVDCTTISCRRALFLMIKA